jgi:uncharacterized metal-binding protein YceD (DUF177 family)
MKAGSELPVFEVIVTTLPASGYPARLRPSETERDVLAKAAGITALPFLEADLVAKRWRRDGVEITGELKARAEQPCVITLEPVFQDINETFRVTFLPERSALVAPVGRTDRELVLDPEGEDPPETFSGDAIDVWAVVFEVLLLAIDPFPRAQGAELATTGLDVADEDNQDKQSPFSVLRTLKPGQE